MIDYKKILGRIAVNWPAKVLSVVAAIFLFAFHNMSDLQERYISVPLHLDLAGNLMPGSVYPQNVRVTLRGTNDIYNISETDIEAHLDLTKYTEPGMYKTQVLILRRGSAAETEILEIAVDPPEISLDLDFMKSKTVPLSLNFQGYLMQGFEMVSYKIEPEQVIIDGPEKLLLSIAEINTDFIDMRGRNADFSTHVRIVNPNPLIRIRGDQTAEFICYIKEQIIINNFDNLPINIRGLNDSFEAILNPPLASVRYNVVQSMLEEIKRDMFVVSVDCSAISESGLYELPLAVVSEKEINIDRIEPEIVNIEIRRKELQ